MRASGESFQQNNNDRWKTCGAVATPVGAADGSGLLRREENGGACRATGNNNLPVLCSLFGHAVTKIVI